MAEVLVWGAEHPDEYSANRVLAYLLEHVVDMPGVAVDIANPRALSEGRRFIDENLVRAYRHADPNSESYERRRAAAILKASEEAEADYVVTLHGVDGHGAAAGIKEFAFVDERRGVSPQVLALLAFLGLKTVKLTRGFGLQDQVHNAVGLELGPDGVGAKSEMVRTALQRLASGPLFPKADLSEFTATRYLGPVPVSVLHPHEIGPEQWASIDAFQPLPPDLLRTMRGRGMDLPPGAFFSAYARKPKDGYLAEVSVTIPFAEVDMSHWPEDPMPSGAVLL